MGRKIHCWHDQSKSGIIGPISGLEKGEKIYYHRPMQGSNISFVDLAPGALSRFIFCLSLALAAVFTQSPAYLCLLLAFAVLALLSWNGHIREIGRIGRYAVVPLILVFLLHLFSHHGRSFFHIWILDATGSGLRAGILYGLKLLVFSYAAGIIFLAVDSFDLISPLERLARLSGRRGRPLGALALSFFLAVRFLPELAQQSRLTLQAFKTRGLDMKGGLLHKARVGSLLIAPMFVNGVKRAELATAALNIKGYATRYSRAVLAPVRTTLGSVITLLISIVFLVAGWRT
jgi:energy-coupling factor transporter transmembrane protein EcfT